MNHTGTEKYVSDLTGLFRDQGTQLYSGEHTLCLTTSCLHSLQKKFGALREVSSSKPVPAKLILLQDLRECLHRIKKLKLISDRKTVAPSLVSVDLSQFRDLHTLVLKRVPINTLTGLQRLREQLQVLKIQRSHITSLDEILVHCGRDNAQAFSWSSLKELDLSGNSLKALGECLNYLPQVQRVDFSNNKIGNGVRSDAESSYNSDYGSINSMEMSSSTEEKCQSLEGLQLADSIEWLHLGFNLLTIPPVLGDRAKFNLKVLILRDNQLKSIAGLEMLERLVELDLCNNLLCQHSELRPLKNMHFLRTLSLSGNPLCYDPHHRILTAYCLTELVAHPTAANFTLDNKKLSSSERKALASFQAGRSPTPSSTASATPTPPSSLARLFVPKKYTSPSPSTASIDTTSTSRPIATEPRLRESEEPLFDLRSLPGTPGAPRQPFSGRKKAREISFDNEAAQDKHTTTQLDSESMTVLPPVNKDRIIKYQDLRKQLDNTWLSTALSSSGDGVELLPSNKGKNSKRKSSKRRRSKKSSSPMPQDTVSPSSFISSSFVQGVIPVPSRQQEGDRFPESFLDEPRPNSNPRPGSHPRPDSRPRPSSHSSSVGAKSPSQELIACNSGYSISIVQATSDNEDQYLDESTRTEDGGGFWSGPPLHTRIDNRQSEEEPILGPDQVLKEQYSEGEKGPSPDELEEKYTVEVWDSGTEEDGHCDTVFLSISDKFLQEIDGTKGDVIDQVDLKCLQSVRVEEKAWGERDKCRVLVLHFSQVRKDRKRREYLLVEDDESSILERLEPVVERNRSIATSTATKLECLKCQRIINFSEAVDVSDSPVSLATMMRDASSPREWSSTRLRKLCPFCREPFLMLLDVEPAAKFGSSPSYLKKLGPQLPEPAGKQLSVQPLTVVTPRPMTSTDSSSGCAQTDSGVGNTVRSPSPSPLDLSYSYRECVVLSFATVANGRDATPALSHDSPSADVSPFVNQASKPAAKGGKELKKSDDNARTHSGQDGWNCALHPSPDVADTIADAMEIRHLQTESEGRVPGGSRPLSSFSQARESPHPNLPVTGMCDAGPSSRPLDLHSSPTSSRSLLNSRPSFGRETEPVKSPRVCSTHGRMHCSCHDRQPTLDPVSQNRTPVKDSPQSSLHAGIWPRGVKSDPLLPWQLTSSDSDGQPGHVDSPPSFRSKSRKWPAEPSSSHTSLSRGMAIPTTARHRDDLDEIEESPFGHDNDTISSSVPSESKIRSYFFGSREKSQREERKKNKEKKGHSRSHSVDCVNKKVPPLPPGMIQQQKAHIDFQDSLGKKQGDSQLSVESGQSDSKNEEERPVSLGVDLQASSGSSEERKSSGSRMGTKLSRFSVNLRRGSKKSPSVTTPTKVQRPTSPVIPYREDDPTYLHNNFTLYLDMEVFDVDQKEHFTLAFKSSMVIYGDWKEIDAFLVVSDRNAYLYRITAPESIQPQNWLELMTTLPLKDIVYIDIGVGYQSLRLEVKNPPRCYTFLVRQEQKCRKFFDKLSYVVSDVSRPSLKSIGVAQFFVEDIRDPSRALREAILHCYDHLSPARSRSSQSDELEGDAEQLEMFLLAHHHQPACEPAQVPVTFVLTNRRIYLGMANPQWPLPKLHPLPDREDLMPPFSAVTRKDVTDVERMILYDDQPYQFTLQFFSEDNSQSDQPSWTLLLKDTLTVKKFVKCISQLWEKEFQQSFPIVFR